MKLIKLILLLTTLPLSAMENEQISLIYIYSKNMIVSVNTIPDIKLAAEQLNIEYRLIDYDQDFQQVSHQFKFPLIHFPILAILKNGAPVKYIPGARDYHYYYKLLK